MKMSIVYALFVACIMTSVLVVVAALTLSGRQPDVIAALPAPAMAGAAMTPIVGSFFGTPLFLHLLGAVATFVWSLKPVIAWRRRVAQSDKDDLMTFAREAVRQTYETWVRATKAKSADGKLTSDDRRQARQKALATLGRLAQGKARELLTERIDAGTADSLIEQAVRLEQAGDCS